MVGEKVKEIIDPFEKLPNGEHDKVIAHLFGVKSLAGVKPVFKKAANEFKRIASEVFDQNRE